MTIKIYFSAFTGNTCSIAAEYGYEIKRRNHMRKDWREMAASIDRRYWRETYAGPGMYIFHRRAA